VGMTIVRSITSSQSSDHCDRLLERSRRFVGLISLTRFLLRASMFAPLSISITTYAQAPAYRESVEAQFRGCAAAGWCRFSIEPQASSTEPLQRIRPDGVVQVPVGDAVSIAIRDRLNALLSNMIHQAKRIVLHDLRALDDGTFAAKVTVNGVDVASDPTLMELREKVIGTNR
jgi:hypothetical protein